MIRNMIALSGVLASVALAQTAVTSVQPSSLDRAPQIGLKHRLACPAGTSQFGGPQSNFGAYACERRVNGERVIQGPIISFDNQGHVVELGQMADSFREGQWKFFDAQGNLTGTTEFKHGEYHGRRLGYSSTGQLQFDEFWVNGKRQGQQVNVDVNGARVVTEYRDGRQVAK